MSAAVNPVHPELDQLTDGLVERAEELRLRAEALASTGFPPGWVEPVSSGWRVYLPGRSPEMVAQLATIFATKRDAQAALRELERGGRRAA